MKLAIVGSRGFDNFERAQKRLEEFEARNGKIDEIISGGAKGADSIAARYALLKNIPLTEFIPDWKKHGNRAGFLRNEDIVGAADMVFAFWDGESKGTKHSMSLATEQKKRIFVDMYMEPDEPFYGDGY